MGLHFFSLTCKLFNARKPPDPGLLPFPLEHTQSCNWPGKEKWRWMSHKVKRFIFENTGKPISTGYSTLIIHTVQCNSRQKPHTLLSLSDFPCCSPSSTIKHCKEGRKGVRGTGAAPIYSETDAAFEPVRWEMSSNTEFLEKLWVSSTAPYL